MRCLQAWSERDRKNAEMLATSEIEKMLLPLVYSLELSIPILIIDHPSFLISV